MIRPSTHPAEQYRRARAALAVQLADVLHLLAHLDPVDQHVAADELVTLLDDVAGAAEAGVREVELPAPRSTVTIHTGGRT